MAAANQTNAKECELAEPLEREKERAREIEREKRKKEKGSVIVIWHDRGYKRPLNVVG